VLAAPRAAAAQPTGKVWRIGWLSVGYTTGVRRILWTCPWTWLRPGTELRDRASGLWRASGVRLKCDLI